MEKEKSNGGEQEEKKTKLKTPNLLQNYGVKSTDFWRLIIILVVGIGLGVLLKTIAVNNGITMGAEDYKQSKLSSDIALVGEKATEQKADEVNDEENK